MSPRSLWTIHAAGAGVSVACVAVAYFVGVRSVVSHRSSAATIEQASVREASTETTLLQSVNAAEQELAAAKAEIDNAPLQIGDSADLNRRLAEVSRLAELHLIEVRTLEVGDSRLEAGCQAAPISFSGQGGFAESIGFVRDLQRTLPDVVIEDLALTGNESNPMGDIRLTLSLAWYTVDGADD